MLNEMRRVANFTAPMAATNDSAQFYMEAGYWQVACIYVKGTALTMSLGLFKYLADDDLAVAVSDSAGSALVVLSSGAADLTQWKSIHAGVAGTPLPLGAGNYFFRVTLTSTPTTSTMKVYVGNAD